MITREEFRRIETAVHDAGYADTIAWSESLRPPTTARQFATKAIFVICSSGMRYTTAVQIHDRCMQALGRGQSATTVFGHPGKSAAIDRIWAERKRLFKEARAAPDLLAFCATLPWIGPVTNTTSPRTSAATSPNPTSTSSASPTPRA